jgi:hypothetical protein
MVSKIRRLLKKLFVCHINFILLLAMFVILLGSFHDGRVKIKDEIEIEVKVFLLNKNILDSEEQLIAYYDFGYAKNKTKVSFITSERIVYYGNSFNLSINLGDVKKITHSTGTFAGDVIVVVANDGKMIKLEIPPLDRGGIYLRQLHRAVNNKKV